MITDQDQRRCKAFDVLDDPWSGDDVCRARQETFLVAPDGVIADHWTDVNPGEDATIVMDRVRERVQPALV